MHSGTPPPSDDGGAAPSVDWLAMAPGLPDYEPGAVAYATMQRDESELLQYYPPVDPPTRWEAVAGTALRVATLGPATAPGCEVDGVDLARPLDGATARAVKALCERHQVCVFRRQQLSDTEQCAFSESVAATAGTTLTTTRSLHRAWFPQNENIGMFTNISRKTGELPTSYEKPSTMLWHTVCRRPPRPLPPSLLLIA